MNSVYAGFERGTKPLPGLWPYPPAFSPCHVSQRPEAARRKNSLSKASSDMVHAAVAHSDMAFLRGLGQGLCNPEADDAGITPKEGDAGGFRVHRTEPQDQNSFSSYLKNLSPFSPPSVHKTRITHVREYILQRKQRIVSEREYEQEKCCVFQYENACGKDCYVLARKWI